MMPPEGWSNQRTLPRLFGSGGGQPGGDVYPLVVKVWLVNAWLVNDNGMAHCNSLLSARRVVEWFAGEKMYETLADGRAVGVNAIFAGPR